MLCAVLSSKDPLWGGSQGIWSWSSSQPLYHWSSEGCIFSPEDTVLTWYILERTGSFLQLYELISSRDTAPIFRPGPPSDWIILPWLRKLKMRILSQNTCLSQSSYLSVLCSPVRLARFSGLVWSHRPSSSLLVPIQHELLSGSFQFLDLSSSAGSFQHRWSPGSVQFPNQFSSISSIQLKGITGFVQFLGHDSSGHESPGKLVQPWSQDFSVRPFGPTLAFRDHKSVCTLRPFIFMWISSPLTPPWYSSLLAWSGSLVLLNPPWSVDPNSAMVSGPCGSPSLQLWHGHPLYSAQGLLSVIDSNVFTFLMEELLELWTGAWGFIKLTWSSGLTVVLQQFWYYKCYICESMSQKHLCYLCNPGSLSRERDAVSVGDAKHPPGVTIKWSPYRIVANYCCEAE